METQVLSGDVAELILTSCVCCTSGSISRRALCIDRYTDRKLRTYAP
jgi:hypothetical protein